MNKSVYQIAKQFNVTPMTVYSWIEKGLPYTHKVNGLKVIIQLNPKEVKEWLEQTRKEK